MKFIAILALVVLVASAAHVNYQVSDISKKCQQACDNEAQEIIKLIPQFEGDFDLLTFLKSLKELKTGYEVVEKQCEGNMWEAIVDIALASVTDDYKTCLGRIIASIDNSWGLYELLRHDKHNVFAIARKVEQVKKDIEEAKDKCEHHSNTLMMAQQQVNIAYISECTAAVIDFYPQFQLFIESPNENIFKIMKSLLSLKEKCFQ